MINQDYFNEINEKLGSLFRLRSDFSLINSSITFLNDLVLDDLQPQEEYPAIKREYKPSIQNKNLSNLFLNKHQTKQLNNFTNDKNIPVKLKNKKSNISSDLEFIFLKNNIQNNESPDKPKTTQFVPVTSSVTLPEASKTNTTTESPDKPKSTQFVPVASTITLPEASKTNTTTESPDKSDTPKEPTSESPDKPKSTQFVPVTSTITLPEASKTNTTTESPDKPKTTQFVPVTSTITLPEASKTNTTTESPDKPKSTQFVPVASTITLSEASKTNTTTESPDKPKSAQFVTRKSEILKKQEVKTSINTSLNELTKIKFISTEPATLFSKELENNKSNPIVNPIDIRFSSNPEVGFNYQKDTSNYYLSEKEITEIKKDIIQKYPKAGKIVSTNILFGIKNRKIPTFKRGGVVNIGESNSKTIMMGEGTSPEYWKFNNKDISISPSGTPSNDYQKVSVPTIATFVNTKAENLNDLKKSNQEEYKQTTNNSDIKGEIKKFFNLNPNVSDFNLDKEFLSILNKLKKSNTISTKTFIHSKSKYPSNVRKKPKNSCLIYNEFFKF